MILLVGLGNPGNLYSQTRHNVGFSFLDFLINKLGLNWETSKKWGAYVIKTQDILYVKPQEYMNLSGKVVQKISSHYKISPTDIWVAHDDLDIVLGEYKIHVGRGSKDHKGINSIIESLGTEDFWRVRIGVDNRTKDARVPGEAYVLEKLPKEEKEKIQEVFEKIHSELKEKGLAL